MNFGDLTELEFTRYYPRSAEYLSTITMGRSDAILKAVAQEDFLTADRKNGRVLMAAFAVAKELQRLDMNDGAGPVVAATNDGVSVTYAGGRSSGLFANSSSGSTNSSNIDQRLYQAAARYLRSTGLLYRGIH